MANRSEVAKNKIRDEFGKFLKGSFKVSQNIPNPNLNSQIQDDTLIDIKLNNPLSALFRAILKSLRDGVRVTIKFPSPIAILLGAIIFGLGGFFFGRQTTDLSNFFVQKNGAPLNPDDFVNKKVVVTGQLNPDKKTFSVFSINTIGP